MRVFSKEDLAGFSFARWKTVPTAEEILQWFEVLEAGWIYDGNPSRPHAKLHSGKCSDGFFLVKKVLKYGNLREILAAAIVAKIPGELRSGIGGVFGAPYSSITLAGDVARLLGAPNYVVEKGPKDESGKPTMVFSGDDPVPAYTTLFQVEDLITTYDSAKLTRDAIRAGNPEPVQFIPFVGTVVHRPPEMVLSYDGQQVLALVNKQVSAWNPADCPWCKQGSIPLLPKAPGNWAKLTAK